MTRFWCIHIKMEEFQSFESFVFSEARFLILFARFDVFSQNFFVRHCTVLIYYDIVLNSTYLACEFRFITLLIKKQMLSKSLPNISQFIAAFCERNKNWKLSNLRKFYE